MQTLMEVQLKVRLMMPRMQNERSWLSRGQRLESYGKPRRPLLTERGYTVTGSSGLDRWVNCPGRPSCA